VICARSFRTVVTARIPLRHFTGVMVSNQRRCGMRIVIDVGVTPHGQPRNPKSCRRQRSSFIVRPTLRPSKHNNFYWTGYTRIKRLAHRKRTTHSLLPISLSLSFSLSLENTSCSVSALYSQTGFNERQKWTCGRKQGTGFCR